ncbi:MAG: SDR family NAD(P)-dependent oxidoreductase [Candidatus Zixiibacteriota bacterium]
MMVDLTDNVALITGSASGIGAATALRLAKSGADIALNHFGQESAAKALAERISGFGRRSHILDCDVKSHGAVKQMVEDAKSAFGKIDILVNNAGISEDSAVWKMTEEMWDNVVGVNLKGCFNTISALAPHFRERKAGRIVNVASINGLRGKFGLANYSASKAGVVGLTRSVARELGKCGVTVNAVAPGFILTDLTAHLSEEIKQRAVDETALGKLGTPDDVAGVIAFLCGADASHITGEVIRIDGGQLA